MELIINKETVLPHLLDLLHSDIPVTILFGSASSGKSYQIMTNAVLWALEGRTVLIARKELAQVRKSVWLECTKAIARMELDEYFEIRVSDFTILSRVSLGAIVFTGVDDENKLKSITAPQGPAIDTVILEEADSFYEEDYDQLRIRCRGETPFPKRAIMIFNPVSIQRMKWVWDRYFVPLGWDDETDSYKKSADGKVLIQRCNYEHNTYLTEDDLEKFVDLKRENPRKYRVYGEGKFGATGKTVFDINKYHMAKLDYVQLRRKGYELFLGVDFGYTHASTLVVALRDKINNDIYVCGILKEKELTKPKFAMLVREKMASMGITRVFSVFCDESEPSSIDTLVEEGVLGATAAKKGKGSVSNQIDFLQSHDIYIDETCRELFREMEVLNFKQRKDGTYTEDLDDRFGDDLVAGLRYGFSWEAYMSGDDVCGLNQEI